jgi:hypothetical protein
LLERAPQEIAVLGSGLTAVDAILSAATSWPMPGSLRSRATDAFLPRTALHRPNLTRIRRS